MEVLNYQPATIPLPSYIMGSPELVELHNRLWDFAIGDPDTTDAPCDRAKVACAAIEVEMRKRGQPIVAKFGESE